MKGAEVVSLIEQAAAEIRFETHPEVTWNAGMSVQMEMHGLAVDPRRIEDATELDDGLISVRSTSPSAAVCRVPIPASL